MSGLIVRSLFDGQSLNYWRYIKLDDTPAPWALTLLRYCERFHALPDAGGILDQDSLYLDSMELMRYVGWLSESDAKRWKSDDLFFKSALDRGVGIKK